MGIFDFLFRKKSKKYITPPPMNEKITQEDEEIIELDDQLLEQLSYRWESADEIIDSIISSQSLKDSKHLKLVEYLVNLIDSEKIELPVLPSIAMKVISMSYNPKTDFNEYGNLVKSDQVIALKVISLANSPFYKGLREVNDLSVAISRIGLDGFRELLIAISMKTKIFNHKFYKDSVKNIWRNSLLSATIGSHIAKLTNIDPSMVYTTTLVHDIGKIVIYNAVSEYRRFYKIKEWPDIDFVQRLSESFHQQISAFTLNHWNFNNEQIDAVRSHHDYPKNETPLLSKILFFSDQISEVCFLENEPKEMLYRFIMQKSNIKGLKIDKIIETIDEAVKQYEALNSIVN